MGTKNPPAPSTITISANLINSLNAFINQDETFADLVILLNIPVVLVVGIKLGCINHALLTAEAIKARNCELYAWVANPIDPNMQFYNENVLIIVNKLQKNNTEYGC